MVCLALQIAIPPFFTLAKCLSARVWCLPLHWKPQCPHSQPLTLSTMHSLHLSEAQIVNKFEVAGWSSFVGVIGAAAAAAEPGGFGAAATGEAMVASEFRPCAGGVSSTIVQVTCAKVTEVIDSINLSVASLCPDDEEKETGDVVVVLAPKRADESVCQLSRW